MKIHWEAFIGLFYRNDKKTALDCFQGSCVSGEKILLFGFFVLALLGVDDFLRQVLRDHFVVVEFHGEVTTATRHGAEAGGVAEPLGQRNVRLLRS